MQSVKKYFLPAECIYSVTCEAFAKAHSTHLEALYVAAAGKVFFFHVEDFIKQISFQWLITRVPNK